MLLEERPAYSVRRLKTTQVAEWTSGNTQRQLDCLAVEEPLEIRVGVVTFGHMMRTPGDDFELAAGFLFANGIIRRRSDIARMACRQGPGRPGSSNVIDVTLQVDDVVDLSRLPWHLHSASTHRHSENASIAAARECGIRPGRRMYVDSQVLIGLPGAVPSVEKASDFTGGLHAAALFDAAGTLLSTREDISRHNAVDKIVGYALLEGPLPLSEHILFVSGRGAFTIVEKALVAGIPVVAGMSPPSTQAVELARENGLTLVALLHGQRVVVYSGEERLVSRMAARLRKA